ncbi:MAG: CRISPR-associated protein Cmr4 [Archaeoglobaceae archaeon]|nr:CRISPR-associated protein Cmr4 [Archaeoglobaceae archaeon]MDK2876257.1 CRISPR-associated protein Cmr4 [Archaeoglobaceae archaeon]
MFEKAAILFMYCETPIHAGAGTSLSIVDLPIQRERITGLPIVQASSLKGVLRKETLSILKRKRDATAEEKVKVLFGPETEKASEHTGCVSPHDARLLLFPVRSLVGVFAWTTCPLVLERLKREMTAAGFKVDWNVPKVDNNQALIASDNTIVANGKVVLEEFAFDAEVDKNVEKIAKWLADNAFPQSDEYKPFREWLPERFVILPDDAFRDFTQLATEIQTRVQLDKETKSVAEGPWIEEHLPSETLLYAPIFISKPLAPKDIVPDEFKENGKPSAQKVLEFLEGLTKRCDEEPYLDRLQIGGDETIGRGIVKVRLNVPSIVRR